MERYDAFLKVGEGSFGSVHKATDKETGEIVAVKVFHNTDEEVVRAAIREARFLSACNHCNIMGLREAYRSGSGRIYLVIEYAEHVLSQQLKLHRRGLPSAAVRSIIFQLLQALKYLHDRNIMHRDCKPANILITSEGMVKLCDFGFARYVESGSKPPMDGASEPLTTYVITRWYRPPEVLVGHAYGMPVDIWAVGCIFAEMVTGAPLFPGASHLDQLYITIKGLGGLSKEQVATVKANKKLAAAAAGNTGRPIAEMEQQGTLFDRLAPHMSRSMMQFLQASLEPDPSKRATADELLAMPYMKEGAWEAATDAAPAPTPAPVSTGSTGSTATTAAVPAKTGTAHPSTHMRHHSIAHVASMDMPAAGAERAPHLSPVRGHATEEGQAEEAEQACMVAERSSVPSIGTGGGAQHLRPHNNRARIVIPQGMVMPQSDASAHDTTAAMPGRRAAPALFSSPSKPSKLGPSSAQPHDPRPHMALPPALVSVSPNKMAAPNGTALAPHPPKTSLTTFHSRVSRRSTSMSGNELHQDQHMLSTLEAEASGGAIGSDMAEGMGGGLAPRNVSPTKVKGLQQPRGITAQSTAAAITKLSAVPQPAGVSSMGATRPAKMERSCSMPGNGNLAVPRCPAPPAGYANAAPQGRANIGGTVLQLRDNQGLADESEGAEGGVPSHPGWPGGVIRKGAPPLHSGMRLQRMQVSPEAGFVSAGPSSVNSTDAFTLFHPDLGTVGGSTLSSSPGMHPVHVHASGSPLRRGISSPNLLGRISGPSYHGPRSREASGSGTGDVAMGGGSVGAGGLPMVGNMPSGVGPTSQSMLSRFGRALSLMGSRGRSQSSHRLSSSSNNMDLQ